MSMEPEYFEDNVSSDMSQEGKDNRFSGRDDPGNLLANLASEYELLLPSGDAEAFGSYEDIYAERHEEESEMLLSELAASYSTPAPRVSSSTSEEDIYAEQKIPKIRKEYKSKAMREKLLFTEDTPSYTERPKQKKKK